MKFRKFWTQATKHIMASFRKNLKILGNLEKHWSNQDQTLKFSFCWTNSTTFRISTATDRNFQPKIRSLWTLKKIVKTSPLKIKLRFKMSSRTIPTSQFSQPWVLSETLTRKMVSRINKASISQRDSSKCKAWETPSKTINSHKIQIQMWCQEASHHWKETRFSKTTCRRTFRPCRRCSKTSESKDAISRWRTKIRWR